MISAVVLSKNNASSIGKTLSSILWCDERIVIDDFSTDDTVKIAGAQKARVYQRHLDDDFSAQRNFGLKKTQGDWILFIDSDEIVSEALQKEIQDTLSRQGTAQEGIVGYFLKRDDIFLGVKLQYGETKHVKLLRLARKKSGTWIRPVHEYWDVKGPTGTLHHPLIHTAHPDVAQFIKDINRYTSINAKFLLKNGVRANLLSIILYPTAKFFQNYFLRLGFLDGTPGCIMALLMSMHSFLTRAKLYLLNHKQ